jgi:uncharacterized membrane-anchored protein
MTGNKVIILATALLALALPAFPAEDTPEAPTDPSAFLSQFQWVKGPGTATMKQLAQIEVPPGFMFTDGESTRTILQAMGNLTDDSEIGFLSPTNLEWFIVFSFSEEGYVKDDEKDKLNAPEMLKMIRKGNDYANTQKEKMGLSPMKIVGWEQEPSYNDQTQNLEWAIRIESEGDQIINYNTRVLGRHGFAEIQLVVDPAELQGTLPAFKQLLGTFQYKPGETYAEYRSGDKLAKYGLAALITGAGVGLAAKTGLLAWILVFFKKAWKFVVAAVVGIGVLLKRIITGRTESQSSTLE